jgi:hypothetical protein
MDWTTEDIEDWQEANEEYFCEMNEYQGGVNFIMSGWYAIDYIEDPFFDPDNDHLFDYNCDD